jgi:hypothetical protein
MDQLHMSSDDLDVLRYCYKLKLPSGLDLLSKRITSLITFSTLNYCGCEIY